jgi:TPR repeat protein
LEIKEKKIMRGVKLYLEAQFILKNIYNIADYLEKKALYINYLRRLRQAAYLGCAEAQFELGLQYEDIFIFGNNPNYSTTKCIYWYKKACIGGVADACNNLAIIYENKGLFEDAILNYKKAICMGDKKALKNLKSL